MEEEILKYMKKYDLTREQAEQLWREDNDLEENAEIEEMTKKAKANFRNQVQGEKKPRKPREVKLDDTKVHIIKMLSTLLNGMSATDNIENVVIKNAQKEITFNIGNDEYSLNLVKHRPPKK